MKRYYWYTWHKYVRHPIKEIKALFVRELILPEISRDETTIESNKGQNINSNQPILEEKYFIQPEGICIDAYGNMYISNEGRNGKGNILLFKPSKSPWRESLKTLI